MTAGEQITYLAIALLDEQLDVVEGTDVLVDLNAGPSFGRYCRQFTEDCRVFLWRGGIYFLCNEQLLGVEIERRKKPANQTETTGTPSNKNDDNDNEKALPYVFPNIHGDGLKVTMVYHKYKMGGGKNFNAFRIPKQQQPGTNSNGNNSSSNGSIAAAAASTTTTAATVAKATHDYYLQLYPSPHVFRKLDPYDARGDYKHQPRKLKNNSQAWSSSWNFFETGETTSPQKGGYPPPTFDTPDALHNISYCETEKTNTNCTDPVEVPFFDNELASEHGTACCVQVVLPQGSIGEQPNTEEDATSGSSNNDKKYDNNNNDKGREVLVGITHRTISPRTNFWLRDVHKRYENLKSGQYVSRFVAYDASYPFDVVARSGWFCLDFANDATEGYTNNNNNKHKSTLAGKNTNVRLELFGETYDCPKIHFASALSEVVGNRSRAILGYGVNDCHPRMFFVEKDEIAKLLTTQRGAA